MNSPVHRKLMMPQKSHYYDPSVDEVFTVKTYLYDDNRQPSKSAYAITLCHTSISTVPVFIGGYSSPIQRPVIHFFVSCNGFIDINSIILKNIVIDMDSRHLITDSHEFTLVGLSFNQSYRNLREFMQAFNITFI